MRTLTFTIIGAIILITCLIAIYYGFTSLKAQQSFNTPPPNDLPPRTALQILDQFRPKGHSLAIIQPNTDIVTDTVFGNVTVGNPTEKTFHNCQFEFASSRNTNGTLVNGTSVVILKQYSVIGPNSIDTVNVPSMHYYRGDRFVLECKSPLDSVEYPLYLP